MKQTVETIEVGWVSEGSCLRVTFDSNVWEKVVCPDAYPDELMPLRAVHRALPEGRINGFFADTFATIEAVKKKARFAYLGQRPMPCRIEWEPSGFAGHIVIEADPNDHPGLPPVQRERLSQAFTLGFKVLPTSRTGALRPPELASDDVMIPLTDEQNADIWAHLHKIEHLNKNIEARGVGMAPLLKLANDLRVKYGIAQDARFDGLDRADEDERRKVSRAFAEWADGDSVALHIAYGIDVFCTNDLGIGAGESILNAENRAWLSSTYGARFMTLDELTDYVDRTG